MLTLEAARQLLQVQAEFDGFYDVNSCRLIPSQVLKEHERQAVDGLIAELKHDQIIGFTPGTRFEGELTLDPL